MAIRSAIGFGMTLIILKFMMTEVFSELEDTLVSVLSLFRGVSRMLSASLNLS